jgi:predicted transcriptional regulator
MELLMEIEKKEKTTAREQMIYSPFAFYMNIGMLKHYGLVYEDGIMANNRKMWKLTKRGHEFLSGIRSIEEVLKHGEKSFLAAECKQSR